MGDMNDFLVGRTIRLRVDAFDPITKQPFDPGATVVLEAVILTSANPHVAKTISSPDFTRVSQGVFTHLLDTTGYDPGVYVWRARATDSVLGIALREDTFVLSPLTT